MEIKLAIKSVLCDQLKITLSKDVQIYAWKNRQMYVDVERERNYLTQSRGINKIEPIFLIQNNNLSQWYICKVF